MTSTSSDEIRSDIEATRARLGSDLDQLSDRVSPHRVAGRTAQDLRRRVSSTTETARHTADQAKATMRRQLDAHPQVTASAEKARQTAGSAAGSATQTVHRQLDAHPQVAAKVQQARDTAGSAVSTSRQKAADNPRTTGLAAGAAALVALLVAVLWRRHGADAD
ncbi:DUF3618 domain-containing protein [Frankia sp. AgB32]|uniref:DUF3618 domain-containing protein n=1 Tax=Frankia sp. AgB32 TaxID=631119 RepID=UPI00200E6925|nr:DUF3618 domain-containing protein [Frankia sp. AgB32]MCK9897925.1 DUF3618 domain-containing protein [Frankia sp. AgB32]